jgi:DNA-binding response OmpR family regulator
MTGPVILLVEDDEAIAAPLGRALASQGYLVRTARTAALALDLSVEQPAPDLVLLDLGLPDLDGVQVARHLRERLPLAVIVMITARGAELDVVVGLDAGADDYVTKPFRLGELLARIRAHLRRGVVDDRAAPLSVGAVVVDLAARRCTVSGVEVALRPREFDLLAELLRRAGEAVSRDKLMTDVWDAHWYGSTKTLDMHVSALRRKLGAAGVDPAVITTLRGFGYRYEASPSVPADPAPEAVPAGPGLTRRRVRGAAAATAGDASS